MSLCAPRVEARSLSKDICGVKGNPEELWEPQWEAVLPDHSPPKTPSLLDPGQLHLATGSIRWTRGSNVLRV